MSDRPRYRLELEAMPSTNGTPVSRLKRALKMLAWYRLRVRSVEELPGGVPHATPGERCDAEAVPGRAAG